MTSSVFAQIVHQGSGLIHVLCPVLMDSWEGFSDYGAEPSLCLSDRAQHFSIEDKNSKGPISQGQLQPWFHPPYCDKKHSDKSDLRVCLGSRPQGSVCEGGQLWRQWLKQLVTSLSQLESWAGCMHAAAVQPLPLLTYFWIPGREGSRQEWAKLPSSMKAIKTIAPRHILRPISQVTLHPVRMTLIITTHD